jgi:DNA-binding beta-propeller fold protein YncE
VLALSDDGNVLYAALNREGVVQRIDLATNAPTLRVPIGDPLCAFRQVVDIEVVPGNARAIVVATGPDPNSPCTPFQGRIDAYDDATRRANSVVSTFVNAGQAIEFGENASTLYASELVGFAPELRDIHVDQSGLVQTNTVKGGTYLENFDYLEGKLFASQGAVLDARTKNVLASFQSTFGMPSALTVDVAKRRAYTLFHDSSECANVGLFDADSAAMLDFLQVPAGDGIGFPAAGDLVVLGNSRFAFRSARSFGKEQVHVLKILQ